MFISKLEAKYEIKARRGKDPVKKFHYDFDLSVDLAGLFKNMSEDYTKLAAIYKDEESGEWDEGGAKKCEKAAKLLDQCSKKFKDL